jgi:cellulose synthase/poly-beta-1,6-N-acetylglucosamine synthase-like glycosyltransferase
LAFRVTAFDPQVPFEAPVWASARLWSASVGRGGAGAQDERDELAIEIAFLADYGVPRDVLLAATKRAHGGVTADQALLGEGHMREEEFYRLLARHLRAPYYRGEIALAPCSDPARAVKRGIAPLAPNARGLRTVLAPRGRALALLLGALVAKGLPDTCAIASPQRLGAVMRFQMRRRVAEEAAEALGRADASLSARSGFTKRQLAAVLLLAVCALFIGPLWPEALSAICAIALWAVFGASTILRFAALAAGDRTSKPPPLDDDALPIYSIITPLYREANVVERLIEALDAIDYPRSKLDIKIVVERDDSPTLIALAKMRLPSRYDIIVAPPGAPTTKPRALNVALPFVQGEIVVVYDAEDQPAPDQLRLAAARFVEDRTIDCLQARLAVDNPDETWITRLFAMEYAALFDIVNPGLATLRAPIALGGSSNHFRTSILRRVGGWDAWNVTEDADLGLRLARFDCRVATLQSDTREEAPLGVRPWFGQRCRWLKGWFQTLAVHLRNPRRLVRELGLARALAAQTLILGSVLGGLFGPPFLAYALWRCVTGQLFAAPTILQTVGNAATLLLMCSGFFAILIPIVLALSRRGLRRLYSSLPLLPFYYCLVSIAAWAALIDLARRPYYWSKTEHGLSDPSKGAARHIRD